MNYIGPLQDHPAGWFNECTHGSSTVPPKRATMNTFCTAKQAVGGVSGQHCGNGLMAD